MKVFKASHSGEDNQQFQVKFELTELEQFLQDDVQRKSELKTFQSH